MSSRSKKRQRKICLKCDENLSYSAYLRYQSLLMCNPKTLKSPSLGTSEIVSHSFNNTQVVNAEADHDVSAGMMDYHPPRNASSATDGVDCVQMENITVTDVTTDDSESSVCDTNDLDLNDLTSDDEEVLLIKSDHINHLEQLEEIRPLLNDTMMDKQVIHVVDSEMSKIARFICQFFYLTSAVLSCFRSSSKFFCFYFFVHSLLGLPTSFQMKM